MRLKAKLFFMVQANLRLYIWTSKGAEANLRAITTIRNVQAPPVHDGVDSLITL